MGGNALKNTVTRRYSAAEYHSLVGEVIRKSNTNIDICQMDVIPSYKCKDSFGDADILYSTFSGKPISVDQIKKIFGPYQIVVNGEVISFDFMQFQIDLIHSPMENYDYALSYFSYNDLGNLIGKLTKRFNLKHGHQGLFLPLYDGENIFENVQVTLDHSKTLEFVGLTAKRFDAGFDTLDDIFNFVSQSPQYNPELYKLENISSIGRIRDRKRDTYKKFLEFGENYTGTVIPYQKNFDKTVFLQQIFDSFPDAYERFKSAVQRLTVQRAVKEKFNGQLVSELTQLSGKELGVFMKKLKQDFNFQPEVLLYLTNEKILVNIQNFFKLHMTSAHEQ